MSALPLNVSSLIKLLTAVLSGLFAGSPVPLPDVSALLPGLYAVNISTGECLMADGRTRRCGSDDAYRWKLVPVSIDGRFHLRNQASNQCLTRVTTAPCGNDPAAIWRLRDAAGDGINVVNTATNTCLGTPAALSPCDDAPARRWSFRLQATGPSVVDINGHH